MSRDEQIEKMAKDLGIAFQLAGTTRFGAVAEVLVEAGYRKASEIFEEIDKILSHKRDFNCSEIALGYEWAMAEVRRQYIELKKKCTEDVE